MNSEKHEALAQELDRSYDRYLLYTRNGEEPAELSSALDQSDALWIICKLASIHNLDPEAIKFTVNMYNEKHGRKEGGVQ